MGRQQRRMPPEKKIREYWADQIWPYKDFDSKAEFLEEGICFACGVACKRAHRAHIHARVTGGSDTVENLHMLCETCHKDSECKEGDAYWRWFWQRCRMDTMLSEAARSGFNVWSEINLPKNP